MYALFQEYIHMFKCMPSFEIHAIEILVRDMALK